MLLKSDIDTLQKQLKVGNFYKIVQQEITNNHQKINVDYGYLEDFTNNLIFLKKNNDKKLIVRVDSVITIAEVENVKSQ